MSVMVLSTIKLFWVWIQFEIALLVYQRNILGVPVSYSASAVKTAVVGHLVHLPCDMGKPDTDISLVLWYKELSPFAIYTVDARSTTLQNAPHKVHPEYSKRAFYNVSSSAASSTESFLSINPVLESDAGEYKCVIEYRRSRTKEQEITLKVIVPPKETIIMDEHGQHLQGLIGPYSEGQSLSLVCESDGGYPLPALTWWKDSTLLDDSYIETPQGFSRNELQLPALQRQDLLVKLSCQARNTFVEAPVSSTIQLDMNLKPLEVKIVSEDRPFSAGQETAVKCRAFGARPPAQVTWWMSGRQLQNANEAYNERDNVTISILRFEPRQEDNEKELSCRAENPQIFRSDIEHTRIIRVHYKPLVSISMDSFIEGKPTDEGKDIVLRCAVRANPPASTIRWKFRDKLITSQSGNLIKKEDILQIKNVQKQNHGVYKCTAANSEGESESKGLLVEVQYIPECVEKRRKSYVVSKQETIRVTCDIDAFPSDVTFHWTMVKAQEAVVVKPLAVNGTTSVVSITPINDEDYGTLHCVTRNSVGEQLKPCVFEILPAGPPESVRNCTVSNRTSESLIVQCEPGSDGGYQQHFYLEAVNTRQEKVQANLTSTKSPFFVVRGLSPASSFILFIYALNANGKSKSVTIRVETLEEVDETNADYHGMAMLTPALMGLVSTVAVLVLCAVLIVAVMKLRPRYAVREEFQMEKKNNTRQTKYSWKDSVVPVSPGPGPDVVPEENFCKGSSAKSIAKSVSFVPDGPFGECLFQDISLDALTTSHLVVKGMVPTDRRKEHDETEDTVTNVVNVDTPLMEKLPGPFSIYKGPSKEIKESPEDWSALYSQCEEAKEQY